MIPVLFAVGATTWTTNGLGGLADAVSCTVHEERNGAYTMSMVYPVDGLHYGEIAAGSPILCDCGGQRGKQVFRVSKITRPINGQVKIEAEHLSYQLSLIPVSPFTATSVGSALSGMASNAAVTCPFTFWTDKATVANYNQTEPASIRSRLGGVQGSILDVYGGEWEFDGYLCRLWNSRGANRGVTIRYGKNITDLSQEENISNTITGVYPYYVGEHAYVELPEKVLASANASNFPFPRTVPLDLSQSFDDTPTVAQLRTKAQAYLAGSGIGVPKVNLKVKFVNLADSDEYENVAALETVELCDTVTVVYEKLGVQATAKIVKTDWDVLAERYTSVEIGDARTTLADTIAQTEEQAAKAVTGSALEKAVQQATNAITGVTGGYIKFNHDGDGHPYEMLIMDHDTESASVNIWRYNSAGWGYSADGGTTYTMAATIGGGIVADFITAGTLTGLNINNGNGTFAVDSAGNVTATSGAIAGWTIDTDGLKKAFTYGGISYRIRLSSTGVWNDPVLICERLVSGSTYRPLVSVDTAGYITAGNATDTFGYSKVLPTGRFEIYDSTNTLRAFLSNNQVSITSNDLAWKTAIYDDALTVTNNSIQRLRLSPSGLIFYDSSGTATGTITGTDAAKIGVIGAFSSGTGSSQQLTTATWKTVAQVSHTAGTFLILTHVAFQSNTSGMRWTMVTNSTSSTTIVADGCGDLRAPVNGSATHCKSAMVVTATSSGTWYLRAYQNSGGNLNATASWIQTIRLS